jgi:osmoprotectant transport system permease protein
MSEAFQELLLDLPDNLANHLLISVLPLMIGLAISIPLAVIAARVERLRYPLMTVVSVVQTVPSLALLALMVPVLIGISALTARWLGFDFSALGFYPTIVALTLYSMLPMVRNTVTGIVGVDPAQKEAARGVGMTDWQSLTKVELPLALPVIIAGIRTATVWTVGIATLATPVGQRCLGNYIFSGLQTRNWLAVLFGCIAAAVLAILLDTLIGGVQRAYENRIRWLGLLSGGCLAALILGGFIAPTVVDLLEPQAEAVAGKGGTHAAERERDRSAIVVGSKTFTEQYILQDVLTDALGDAGIKTEQRESLGSTVIFDGLVNNEIDCYVDYTGTIWANHMEREGSAPAWKVLDEVSGWLAREHGARCLGPLGFENAYALAMRRDEAERLGIKTIEDLAKHAPQLSLGSGYEFFSRPEWTSLRDAYGLRFDDRQTYDPTFMYEAVKNGEVDVIAAFSSDGRIRAYDLVVLDDPRHVIPPYDAVILLSPQAAARPRVAEALKPLLEHIDVSAMRQANYMVDREKDKKSVTEAARWLYDHARQGQTEENPS